MSRYLYDNIRQLFRSSQFYKKFRVTCSELAQVLFSLMLRDNFIITVTAVTLLLINWQCPKKLAFQSYTKWCYSMRQKTYQSDDPNVQLGSPFLIPQTYNSFRSTKVPQRSKVFHNLQSAIVALICNPKLHIIDFPDSVLRLLCTPSHENKLFYLVK